MTSGDGWGFRVASGPEDGWGHMQRTIALAEYMERPVRFYLDPGSRWPAILQALGFDWIEEERRDGSARFRGDLAAGRLSACLVDGYRLSDAAVTASGKAFVAVIADFPGTYPVDCVLAPGLNAERDVYVAGRSFVGVQYALLRKDFAAAHRDAIAQVAEPACRRIVVAFGGRDNPNATGLVLAALARLQLGIPVDVVLTGDAPHRAAVEAAAAGCGARVLFDVADMPALYGEADLAIGAGGVSLLERLCCGVPSIVVALADNQMPNAMAAEELGVAQFAGVVSALGDADLAIAIQRILDDPDTRIGMRDRGLALVDGLGAQRVSRAMEEMVWSRDVNTLSL